MNRTIVTMAFAGLVLAPAQVWADSRCCGEASTAVTPSTSASGVCAPACNACRTACASCCQDQRVQCCRQRTSYRLVRECQPVCRQRTVCHHDPCNPRHVTRTIVNECRNRVRYRWVAYTKPVCDTHTARVCTTPAGQVFTESASGRPMTTVEYLAQTVRNQ